MQEFANIQSTRNAIFDLLSSVNMATEEIIKLLDYIMLYWLPKNGASSARWYWESFNSFAQFQPITIPTGCSIFPKEIFKASQRWVETRFKDLRYFNVRDTGGHFAAFEQPELYVQELRACFQKMS